jgi:predicted esterase YcpF (UPF0227 family)
MPQLTHLLYLHGFRSSPRSAKCQKMGQAIHQLQAQGRALSWVCPQLPPSPVHTMQLLRDLVESWPKDSMAVIGSSLGGFYATVLAEELGCRAAIINPAVNPARDLARHIGEQTSFHDPQERFFFQPDFIPAFEALSPYPITRPERYWALIAEGDEVLDWREMFSHYQGAQVTLLDGSDHAVSDFDAHLPSLLQWLDLTHPSNA